MKKYDTEQLTTLSEIAGDTLKGLSANPKYLLPKYFYNDRGSIIFQNIMNMPEYYLTRCEQEILSTCKKQIVNAFLNEAREFDLIELGSGNGLKTRILLRELSHRAASFTYMPIDISSKANDELVAELKTEIPELSVEPKTGDYFKVMKTMKSSEKTRIVILFLGSNIGNFSPEEISLFLNELSCSTLPGDKVMIGFDLKKSPAVIMKAYDDPYGYTRNFNLNHLARINDELGADFSPDNFEHHTEYNPVTGDVKSYLVSKTEQTVYIKALETSIRFKQWEPLFMELSRKFDFKTIQNMATGHGFRVMQNFTDHHNYFVDSLWVRE